MSKSAEAWRSYDNDIPCQNGIERAFENQKCITVSLACVYNDSLVLKTGGEKSLSKTATFLTSAI